MKSKAPSKASAPAAIPILTIREQRVMLDSALAAVYGVTTGRFHEAVKRNAKRFPEDFTFVFTAAEHAVLRSQLAILKKWPRAASKISPARFYRTWRPHGRQRFEQRPSRGHERLRDSGFRGDARNPHRE